MKKLSYLFCLALLASPLGATQWLTFKSAVADSTRPYYQSEVRATFEFKNDTDREIQVTQIAAACHCTYAAADQRAYGPGQTGVITVIINQDEIERNRGVAPITVTLTDAAGGYHVERLAIQVDTTKAELFRLSESILVWEPGETDKSQRLHASSTVQGGSYSFAVLAADGSPTNAVVVSPTQAMGSKVNVRITPKTIATPGVFLLKVTVKDASNAAQTKTIPLVFQPAQRL